MNKYLIITVIALTILMTTPLAQAENNPYNKPMLSLTMGEVGVFDEPPKNATGFGIEYRLNPVTKWKIIPAYGYSWSANGSKYIYADLKRNWHFKNKWVLTGSLATGWFDNNQNIDLGNAIEFRSGIELSYQLQNDYRIGVSAYHLSNSRLSNKNPGTESIYFSLLIPLKNTH
jgi:hypothetical protein